MFRFVYLALSLWLLARRVLLLHLAVVNEGSPTPEAALKIEDITLSQALYGKLAAGEAAHFQFQAAPHTLLVLSMLVPERFYTVGFHPTIVVQGPGLPADGLLLPSSDAGKRQGSTSYQRTQQHRTRLAGGAYHMVVTSPASGVYCLCCGSREPDSYADPTTQARVQALLNEA